MSNYITFHNHDTMSLLDSCLKTKDLVSWAKANNMSAVGVTNHGEMSSLLSLYKECKKQDIKPILGIEFYVTKNELDQDGKKIRDNHHLIVLCKNFIGWKNLIKLHNLSWRDDRFFYDPRITLEDLIKYKDGLIITSACIGGVVGKLWLENRQEEAKELIIFLQKEFGEDFYLELQNHNDENLEKREEQHKYNKFLIKLSKELNIKCVIQNDSHYYLKEDWEAHQVLLCKNTGSKLSNPKFKFGSKEYYLKNEAEVVEIFNEYPLTFIEECFANTLEIANKIEEFDITNKEYDCPTFGKPEETYKKLVELTKIGLLKRFGKQFINEHPEYLERVRYELSVVAKLKFVDYFLMLVDLVEYANKNNVYLGIGRGSGGGSLILYCLGVTQIDPIKYNLLFERFLNEDRVGQADYDIDISDIDRPQVIEYVKNRFGKDHVCNIGTYGELTAKASFKAVASVLEIPFDKANSLSSIMNSELTLKENYEQLDTFRCACDNDKLLNKAYNIALKLEGTYATRGTHACGMVISSKPLNEVCGCVTVKETKSGNRIISTSNEMKELDGDLKVLKMDYLGLTTLSIIKKTDEYIQAKHNIHPDYKNLDTKDVETYKNLSEGNTLGVFQFESQLMKRLLKQIKPNSIEDLSCVTALARPGCLESGLTQQYLDRKNGISPVVSFAKGTEDILKETLQIPAYQEQIMLLSRKMAGFTGSEADTLRKYIGKKDPEKLKAERNHFVEGCVKSGYDKNRANEIFDGIEKCGRYLFNKSHSVGYSLMSYATAYYKTHYPLEYMTALLNSVPDDLDKLNAYISECYRLGISIVPPDINTSEKEFVINENNEIVFGLNAIKGLGKSAITDIMRTRKDSKFTSIVDFIERTSKVDKSNIQALLRVGAFNSLEKYPLRWDKLCDYVSEAKTSKTYQSGVSLEESIYTIVGTKNAKKNEKYIEITDLKRKLGASKSDKVKKEEYNKKIEQIINLFIEETKKFFQGFSGYKPSERIENEQELLGFNISINPYKRWNDLKKYFIPKDENNLKYIELNELFENAEKYYTLPKFQTVGLLTDIKEIKTKKGDKMAKLTLEYFGVKTVVTVFSKQWQNDLEFKVQKGNLILVVGRLAEANKQYSTEDYEIRLSHLRQLNVLVNENIKCIIDINNKDKNSIDSIVKRVANNDLENNLPIEKIILYELNGKYMILSGLNWINSADKLSKELA